MKKTTRRVSERARRSRARRRKDRAVKARKTESGEKKRNLRGKVKESANELLLFYPSRGDSHVCRKLSLFWKRVSRCTRAERERARGKIRLFRPRLTKAVWHVRMKNRVGIGWLAIVEITHGR